MIGVFAAAVALIMISSYLVVAGGNGARDEFGYNYQANTFVGKADGVDRAMDGAVWGDPTYANDHLVMKWSQAWDDARFNGGEWTPEAWCTNEWNGQVNGGSGINEVVKIIWVGAALEDSPYWREGGYPIWGEFEVIMDHYPGADDSWLAHATPGGLGNGIA